VPRRRGIIAVSLHDVEPATFERCALIRDWLGDLGIDRLTLLVIPAPDLHPFHDRRPDLAAWLEERARDGDAIAQHGLEHRRGEFAGLSLEETRRAVLAGRRVLKLAGVQPRGFVAPAYAYTPALRDTLATTFDWWAGLGRIHHAHRGDTLAPALCFGTTTRVRRVTSPLAVRAGAALSRDVLRLELHPADLEHRRCVKAVEKVLRRAEGRAAVTYDDLV
jgi:predicted deacetylase